MNDTFDCVLCCNECEAKPEQHWLCDDCYNAGIDAIEQVRGGEVRAEPNTLDGFSKTINGFDAATLVEFRVLEGIDSHEGDAE